MSPQPEGKLSAKGDDAQQVSQDNSMMVVVDGVGGWHKKGVDVSKFSWALANGIGKAFHESPEKGIPWVLQQGHFNATKQVGSATVCLAHLKGNSLLTANLGDSGQAILRSSNDSTSFATHFKSPPMQHSHNHPFQLAWDDSEPLDSVAQRTHTVNKGDIIVLATDGFWDNVWEEQMNETVSLCVQIGMNATDIAKQLVIQAVKHSKNTNSITPWTKDCQVAMGELPKQATQEDTKHHAVQYAKNIFSYSDQTGGKPDDTTVIIGIVCEKDTMIVSKI